MNQEIEHTGPTGWVFTPGEGWKYVNEQKQVTINDPGDSIVMAVIEEHITRATKGKQKYNKTLDRTDLALLDYLQHAKEEAMDLALYLEKAIRLLNEQKDTLRNKENT